MKFKTKEDVRRYLEKIPRFQAEGPKAARFDLERFRRFCAAAGDPQTGFQSIHVAGTNGKGSTCQILASIYREAGYRVGLYTSPHLVDFNERFEINGRRIREGELLRFFRCHDELISSFRLTYFELSTAIAFWWFSRREVDLGIIEVGLGGRLDATNVITPALSVITSISLDHTGILGDTIPDIAREKAGIIKRGVPVVVGKLPDEAEEVIRKVAEERSSPYHDIRELSPEWEAGGCVVTEKESGAIRVPTDLSQPVQANNIALAWQAVSVLQPILPVGEQELKKGVGKVGRNYTNTGRFEKLDAGREWYFDGAHNPEAVAALVEMVNTIKPVGQWVLVLSIMKDKLNRDVADEFQKFKNIYYYKQGSERAAGYEIIKQWFPGASLFPGEKARQERFLKELESELVIFAGSFYFYPTVREWLQSSTSGR